MAESRSFLQEYGPSSNPLRWAGAIGGLILLVIVVGFIALTIWAVNSERPEPEPEPEPDHGMEVQPTPPPEPPRVPVTPAPVEPDAAAPRVAEVPAPTLDSFGAGGPDEAPLFSGSDAEFLASTNPLDVWARDMATVVDAPARALRAYANADAHLRAEQPGCGISWTMLVGIGRVESDHGRVTGGVIGEDGRITIPIYGPPLDGSPGVMAIPDTDGGELDGDDVWDRAMGPVQFLPTTWHLYGRDANGDGVADPQNIDDAVLSAATYLCSEGGDLTTGVGWWTAVMTYNNSVDYGQRVFNLAETYAGYVP
ncbi:lytic transglycosylase domain-containing protein [Actinoalloteichus hymeniacidonis]|uniref:Transglycosylase SLT domain n=1 Tax=Actinoalloteichus hymeniacidonis TaxID=340345 RepID=A0AAC9HLU3_9PSEU|nr:lytic murein transglycosylase [Actinoalloteichus hymeniacidonis]AOS61583.1 Transglycosylase SLT domain [Actinoalloteichus hymeniacidonis]MBB5910407.1 hypothetical protein [Actinoalloteichus hymeniacidonis]